MIKKIQFLEDRTGAIVALFDITDRRFIETALIGFHTITPASKFTAMLSAGITKESIQPYLRIPEMKTLWTALTQEVRPVMLSGQAGVCTMSGERKVVRVGPVTGYRLRPKGGTDILREAMDISTGVYYDIEEARIDPAFDTGDTKAIMDFAGAEIQKVLAVTGLADAKITIGEQTFSVKGAV